ncbi:hypothetical protein PR048_033685 [Dryococelus australis]|uniref:Uncharacterized protein n=1 Tax=Dryococelus australis TaxID=614101 RepID=A0ABQ9G557_9NEOP|nr:hypothetical protein PR048_033685 [Dryococelus australis]
MKNVSDVALNQVTLLSTLPLFNVKRDCVFRGEEARVRDETKKEENQISLTPQFAVSFLPVPEVEKQTNEIDQKIRTRKMLSADKNNLWQ